jgi:hypothetical protein
VNQLRRRGDPRLAFALILATVVLFTAVLAVLAARL